MIQNFSQEGKQRQPLQILSRTLMIWIVIGCMIFVSCGDEGEVVEPPDVVEQPDPPDPNGQLPPADGEDQDKDDKVEPEPVPPPVPLPGLPAITAGYQNWLKLNAKPIPPVAGGDPHNGNKNVFVNQKKDTIAPGGVQKFPYPDGSIVVKESTRPGKDFIGLIAIMEKKKGANAPHNDWIFTEYTRNANDAVFKKIAEGVLCSGCHSQVKDRDYVFVRLGQ